MVVPLTWLFEAAPARSRRDRRAHRLRPGPAQGCLRRSRRRTRPARRRDACSALCARPNANRRRRAHCEGRCRRLRCLRLLRCLRGGRSLFHPSVASQAIGGTATGAAITGTAPRAVTTGATSGTIAAPWTTVTGLGVDHVEDDVSDGRVVDVVPAHGVGAGDVLAEPLGAGPVGEQRTRGRGCGSAGSRRRVRRRSSRRTPLQAIGPARRSAAGSRARRTNRRPTGGRAYTLPRMSWATNTS